MRTLLVSLAVLVAPSALAASPEPQPPSRFYIFDGSSFEAGPRSPALDYFGPRQSARFGRLLELKKDLMPGLAKTLKERALK